MVTAAPGAQLRAVGPAPVDRPGRWPVRIAVALAVIGIAFRLGLLLADLPPTNSDEATMGLAALHLAQGRELPVFFYGQYYMGALEAYLAAPFFLIMGASTLALRLPLLGLYAVFLLLMWRLTCRLYTPWLAAFTVGLLAFGSDRIIKNQLVALGGYPEMNPAGALLLLLAVNLGLGRVRHRTLAYAGWGLVAGLMLWADWLLLPYVGVAGLLLLAPAGRRPSGRQFAALSAGALLGAGPLVAHNLTAPFEQNSLSVFLLLNGGSGGASLSDRLFGAVWYGVPMGGTGLCGPGACARWQLWWGGAYPVLLAVAGILAVRALRRAGAGDRGQSSGVPGAGGVAGAVDERVRQAGRLALTVAAALTLLAYLRSGPAATTPEASSRYLSCLLISTPAVLWPVWSVVSRHRAAGRAVRASAGAVLVALAGTVLLATAAVVDHVPTDRRLVQERDELVTALHRLGVNRFYADYWSCNVLTFVSREKLICAVIGNDLRPGQDRYAPYRRQVDAAPLPAYVLPAGSPLNAALAGLVRGADPAARVTAVGGYHIYQPTRRVGLPLA